VAKVTINLRHEIETMFKAPKAPRSRLQRFRGEGYGRRYPLPSRIRDLGNVVSSPSRVRARPKMDSLHSELERTQFGIGIRHIRINFVNM